MNVNELKISNKVWLIDRLRANPNGLPFRYGEPLPSVFQQMEDEGYFTRYSAEPGIMRLLPTQKLNEAIASLDETELRRQANAEFPPGPVGGYECGCV